MLKNPFKFNFDLNKDWKKGENYLQRRFDNDFISLKVPWYEISQFGGNCAIIFNGRQLIVRKLPGKQDYFIDKHLGMFEINPDKSFFLNKTAVYFYDVRNQNAINPVLLNDLYMWANFQGLYKIRRVDVEHAKRLKLEGSAKLTESMALQKKETRKFMADVLSKIKKTNAETELKREQEQGEKDSDEYHLLNDNDTSYLIVKNLFEFGYIDSKQAQNLNHKLTLKQIKSTDDLLHEVDTFADVYISKPISHELERLLDDFHTYKPREIIGYIKSLSKIRGGISKLRTKAVINWFPSMYILFGLLGVGIVIILYFQYAGTANPSELIPGG